MIMFLFGVVDHSKKTTRGDQALKISEALNINLAWWTIQQAGQIIPVWLGKEQVDIDSMFPWKKGTHFCAYHLALWKSLVQRSLVMVLHICTQSS